MCCFLQAEVGLRYGHVTGVQTCALPIYCSAIRISTGVSRVSSGDAPNITRALRLSSHQNSDRVSASPRERRASERSSLIVRRTDRKSGGQGERAAVGRRRVRTEEKASKE